MNELIEILNLAVKEEPMIAVLILGAIFFFVIRPLFSSLGSPESHESVSDKPDTENNQNVNTENDSRS